MLTAYSQESFAWDNSGIKTIIKDVTVLQDGSFYVTAKDDVCDGGSDNKNAKVYLGKAAGGLSQTTNGVNMLLSIALTAQTTQSVVTLYADDSRGEWACLLGAIKIHGND